MRCFAHQVADGSAALHSKQSFTEKIKSVSNKCARALKESFLKQHFEVFLMSETNGVAEGSDFDPKFLHHLSESPNEDDVARHFKWELRRQGLGNLPNPRKTGTPAQTSKRHQKRKALIAITRRAAAAHRKAVEYAVAVDARRPSGFFFPTRQTQMIGSVSAIHASAAEATERATSADAQTHKQLLPPVRGPTASNDSENDPVVGKRIRKSFGSRFFWGSVVGCYYIADASFYKISFDDGDVDILAAAEVLEDVKQAEKHAKEDTFVASTSPVLVQEPADDAVATSDPSQQPSYASRYQDELRQATLKRKRDEPAPEQEPEAVSDTYSMKVWDQRLFLSIVTNKRVTTVAEFVRRGDGSIGEVEASGKVKIGDIISHINNVSVAGMDSGAVSDRIKASRRPIEITFRRPRPRGSISFSDATEAAPREKAQERRPVETDAVRVTDPRTGAEAAHHHTPVVPPAAINQSAQASTPVPTTSNHPVAAPSPPIPAHQPSSGVVSTTASPQYPEQQQMHPQHDPARRSGIPQHAPAPAYSNNNSNPHFAQQPERQPSPMQQQQQYQQEDLTQQFAPAPAYNNSSNFTFTHQSANQASMQQYSARLHPQTTQQGYDAASHPSFPTNTAFGQQPHGAVPNASAHAWNNPSYRSGQPVRKVEVSFYGTQTTPQPQPSTNSYNLSQSSNHPPSYPRSQYPPPQAATAGSSQQFVGSHHPTAMATQYPQQVSTSTWLQSGNGNQTVVSNFPVSSSGTNVPNSFMAPSAKTTPEYDHRPRSELPAHRSTRQPLSTAVQNSPYVWTSSHPSRFDSAVVESPSQRFSENGSRFSVIESAQEDGGKQQQQLQSEAVDNSGTESDEARGAFVLEEDFDDDEKELASVLGTDMTLFSDPSVAAEAPPPAEEMSFLSPNKPSFVSKLPDNAGSRSHQFPSSLQYQQQQPFIGQECAVVRIRRNRLYVTLGSLGSRVSVTSFVRGKDGETGEIERSGKVLLGDTIVAINGVPVAANTSPTDIARVVVSLPRPFELYFQRASWDVLDGQE